MSERPEYPNLLFIFSDQQRADTMAAYGNDWVSTPGMNRLAERGCVIENCYVSSPICTPSRSTIMTGTWPHSNGAYKNNVPLPHDVDTVVDHIPDSYHKAYFGKWHLGDENTKRRGFDEWHPIEDAYRVWTTEDGADIMSPYHSYLVDQGYEPDAEVGGRRVFSRPFAHSLPEEHTKASYLGREVSSFIERNRDRPFALYVNFLEPHFPYTGPLNDMYDPMSLPESPVFMKDPPDDASLMAQLMAAQYKTGEDDMAPNAARELRGEKTSPSGQEESDLREIQARYFGLVTLLDRAVERILDSLEQAGVADRTIVVFTSEHGDQLGDHGILHKMVMYEETVKVPMLIRVPWLEAGRRIPGRYSHIDTVPTLLDLLGFTVPSSLQGESKASVISGESTLGGNDVFVAWHGRGLDGLTLPMSPLELQRDIPHRVIISSEGWKLNLAVGDFCELYDLNSDPYEEKNLFYTGDHADRAVDLARRIRAWQDANGDRVALPDVYPGAGYVAGMR